MADRIGAQRIEDVQDHQSRRVGGGPDSGPSGRRTLLQLRHESHAYQTRGFAQGDVERQRPRFDGPVWRPIEHGLTLIAATVELEKKALIWTGVRGWNEHADEASAGLDRTHEIDRRPPGLHDVVIFELHPPPRRRRTHGGA